MAILRRNLWILDLARTAAPRLEVANTLWKRSWGLLGRRSIEPDSGMWFEPCGGIHTLGMLFAIDVVFLNKSGEIIHLAPNLAPWRICGPIRSATVVIELPAGALAKTGITLGMRLMLNNADEPHFPESG